MATKTYNAVSPQIAVLQTSTKTFSINSNLKPAEVNHFAELVHGTIRFNLQDFSNGKGDKSIFVYYNMEIFEVYDLMDHVKWQQKFSAQKIHGKYPEKEGKFAGMLCNCWTGDCPWIFLRTAEFFSENWFCNIAYVLFTVL